VRRILWSVDAAREYREIIAFIAEDDPQAAAGVSARIRRSIEALADMPTGRKGRVAGTYEKVVSGLPYVVAYALGETPAGGATLTVLRVIHGARNWPEDRWPGNTNRP
jgi:plasmid stabilization system protein ParE